MRIKLRGLLVGAAAPVALVGMLVIPTSESAAVSPVVELPTSVLTGDGVSFVKAYGVPGENIVFAATEGGAVVAVPPGTTVTYREVIGETATHHFTNFTGSGLPADAPTLRWTEDDIYAVFDAFAQGASLQQAVIAAEVALDDAPVLITSSPNDQIALHCDESPANDTNHAGVDRSCFKVYRGTTIKATNALVRPDLYSGWARSTKSDWALREIQLAATYGTEAVEWSPMTAADMPASCKAVTTGVEFGAAAYGTYGAFNRSETNNVCADRLVPFSTKAGNKVSWLGKAKKDKQQASAGASASRSPHGELRGQSFTRYVGYSSTQYDGYTGTVDYYMDKFGEAIFPNWLDLRP